MNLRRSVPVQAWVKVLAAGLVPAISSPEARAAGDALVGLWQTPVGLVRLEPKDAAYEGRIIKGDKRACDFERNTLVLRGEQHDGTFVGELKVCPVGKSCQRDTWVLAMLMLPDEDSDMVGGAAVTHCVDSIVGPSLRFERRVDPAKKARERAASSLKQGQDLLEARQYGKAVDAFKAALAGDEAVVARARRGLGESYLELKQLKLAEAAFLDGVKASDDAECQIGLARVYALRGDKPKALRALRSAATEGFRDIGRLEKEPDLKSVRGEPEWAEIRKLVQSKSRKGAGRL